MHTYEADYVEKGVMHTVRLTLSSTNHLNWGTSHPYAEALKSALSRFEVEILSIRLIKEHAIELPGTPRSVALTILFCTAAYP